MKKFLLIVIAFAYCAAAPAQNTFVIDENTLGAINEGCLGKTISGGDTIFIDSSRTKGLVFIDINGEENLPVVIINKNGPVKINAPDMETAVELRNCSHIKLLGTGSGDVIYGFELTARNSGVSVTELSTNIEISHIKVKHDGFFGIVVKKDYDGNPPNPIPVFEKLVIHDCLIENVTEGMYLGETKTPGMEFKQVKVYNNIVVNTGRDGIQVANMVEDIEVFNNLVMNSGQDQLFKQGNNLQIGDNCVGDFHHNILLNANAHGIIVLGAGDINISENYFGENQGLFIDNRSVTIANAEIVVNGNYFRNIKDDAIVKIGNELNPIVLVDNIWYSTASYDFFDVISDFADVNKENNIYKIFEAVSTNNYSVNWNNNADINTMGPQENLRHSFNWKPVFGEILPMNVQVNTLSTFEISASTADSDSISFQLQDEHAFIQLNEIENRLAEIVVNPLAADTGNYEITIVAWDHSHKHKSREKIKLTIRNLTSNTSFKLNQDLKVYPNPACHKIVVQNSETPITSLNLVTLGGEIVQTYNTKNQIGINTFHLNREIIKPGTYLLMVNFCNNTRHVVKLIIR